MVKQTTHWDFNTSPLPKSYIIKGEPKSAPDATAVVKAGLPLPVWLCVSGSWQLCFHGGCVAGWLDPRSRSVRQFGHSGRTPNACADLDFGVYKSLWWSHCPLAVLRPGFRQGISCFCSCSCLLILLLSLHRSSPWCRITGSPNIIQGPDPWAHVASRASSRSACRGITPFGSISFVDLLGILHQRWVRGPAAKVQCLVQS